LSDTLAPEPTPPTPHEVRDEMIRDYTEHVRSYGVEPAREDIERIVQSDLQVADAVQREQVEGMPCNPDERKDTAKEYAEERGMTLFRRPIPDSKLEVKDPILEALCFGALNEREMAMYIRIATLIAPRGELKGTDIRKNLVELADPELARRWLSAVGWYKAARKGIADDVARMVGAICAATNIFAGLKSFGLRDDEVGRRMWREIFDICEASTGRWGAWDR
jgi:hypothetical protein